MSGGKYGLPNQTGKEIDQPLHKTTIQQGHFESCGSANKLVGKDWEQPKAIKCDV